MPKQTDGSTDAHRYRIVPIRKGLEAASDASYGVPEAEYARLVLKGIPVTP